MAEKAWRIYGGSYEAVFEETQRAMVASGFRLKSSDPGIGKVVASAGMSMMSYGETIVAMVVPRSDGIVVDIQSSAVGLTDWGKSRENVGKIFWHLDNRLGYSSPTAYGGGPGSERPPLNVRTGPMASADPGYNPTPTSMDYGTGYGQTSAPMYVDTSPLVWPVALIIVNAAVAFLLAVVNVPLFLPISYFIAVFGIILVVAAALIAAGAYAAGAILAFVGGAITVPIGILSIIAGFRAWSEHKARRAARSVGHP